MTKLTGKQRRFLRGHSNRLKATVHIGKDGITSAVLDNIAAEFEHRELLKLALNQNCPEDAKTLAQQLARQANSHWVQTIGRTVVIYRAGDPPEIQLPTP